MATDIKGRRCEKCGSTMTYIRLSSCERICRNCGYRQIIKIEEKK